MTLRERLERKLEKRLDWAEKAKSRSQSAYNASCRIADNIPLGQPILVGHHSERHARRDVERIHSAMTKCCEQGDLARSHESKAAGIEAQLENSIFSDDLDAIEKLKEKIEMLEKEGDHMKEVNKAFKKAPGDKSEKLAYLVQSNIIGQEEAMTIAKYFAICHYQDKPYASYSLTNLNARIRTAKERIKQIEYRNAKAEKAEQSGGIAIEGDEYVSITFSEKPEWTVLKALKAANFWYRGGSWNGQRAKIPQEVTDLVNKEQENETDNCVLL